MVAYYTSEVTGVSDHQVENPAHSGDNSHHKKTSRSMPSSPVCRTSSYLLPLLLLCVFSAQWCGGAAVGCDDSCANGGRLLMPSNVFGVCRCKCPAAFSGPKCQFAVKKRDSSSSLLHLTPASSSSSPSSSSSASSASGAAASQLPQHDASAAVVVKPQAQHSRLGGISSNLRGKDEEEEERMLKEQQAEYGAGQSEEDLLRALFMSHRL